MEGHGDCVICGTDMTEVFHYPVKNHCACTTRVCQHCRARVYMCPTCRHPKIGTEVDRPFLESIALAVTGKTCEGCSRFIRSRHTIKHAQECPQLLALRLRETMDESLQQERQYRDMIRHNEHLASQINDMTYQLFYMRDRHRVIVQRMGPLPREVIQYFGEEEESDEDEGEEDDEEEEGEVRQTLFHVPARARAPPHPPTLV